MKEQSKPMWSETRSENEEKREELTSEHPLETVENDQIVEMRDHKSNKTIWWTVFMGMILLIVHKSILWHSFSDETVCSSRLFQHLIILGIMVTSANL